MRIVFFGTPEFAASQLEAIYKKGYDVAAVVTVPDKPAGRGKQLRESDVKIKAQELALPVLQPEKLKDEVFVSQLKAVNADVFVVVAFRMLPEVIWAMPPKGTFNLHASLLPQYRGAAPINHAIMNGEKKTGVTTFFLNKDIDTGEIILQKETEIGESEDVGSLYDRLMLIGNDAVIETLKMIEKGNFSTTNQNTVARNTILHPAPKIFKEDCYIDWSQSVETAFNFIRGLSPYPAAHTIFRSTDGKSLEIKIFKSSFEKKNNQNDIATILTDEKSFLKVRMRDGDLSILTLQQAGKKTMNVEEFLRGTHLDGFWNAFSPEKKNL